MEEYCRCQCYFSDNIYVKELDTHFSTISTLGGDLDKVSQQVEMEVQRRNSFVEEQKDRREKIKNCYGRLHSRLFELQDSFLDDRFKKLVARAKLASLGSEKSVGFVEHMDRYRVGHPDFSLFRIPVFSTAFCAELRDELENFSASGLPNPRPNTMNNYGVLLDDIGFRSFFDDLRENWLSPLGRALFPEWAPEALDSHRAFTVSYSLEKDTDLGFHFDNAELTLNVGLTPESEFSAGELVFLDFPSATQCSLPISHRVGWGLLHCARQLHSALPVSAGRRDNLILWMRCSALRNRRCPMCRRPPVLIPVQDPHDYGDGFRPVHTNTVDVCSVF